MVRGQVSPFSKIIKQRWLKTQSIDSHISNYLEWAHVAVEIGWGRWQRQRLRNNHGGDWVPGSNTWGPWLWSVLCGKSFDHMKYFSSPPLSLAHPFGISITCNQKNTDYSRLRGLSNATNTLTSNSSFLSDMVNIQSGQVTDLNYVVRCVFASLLELVGWGAIFEVSYNRVGSIFVSEIYTVIHLSWNRSLVSSEQDHSWTCLEFKQEL